jgi:predicted Zn finger-like uncharacterized protein
MSIRISCPACGTGYSVADELSGKRVRCRSCEAPVLVRTASKTRSVGPPPLPGSTKARKSQRDDEADEARPRRKKKKGRSPLQWGLVASGIGVTAVAVVTAIFLTGAATPVQPVMARPAPAPQAPTFV